MGDLEYTAAEPPPALTDVVLGCWGVRMDGGPREERVFPTPALHLIVNGSGAYTSADPAAGTAVDVGDVFCSGLQSRVLHNRNPERILNVGARVRLDAARSLGLDPLALAGRVVPVDAPDLGALATALRAGTPLAEVVSGLFAALATRRAAAPDPEPKARAFVDAVERDPARRIADLAVEAGVSHKPLIDAVRAATGVTPKTVADVVRFDRFIDAVSASGRRPWSDLAAEAGFADQSHLIRVFRAATGLTPGRYIALVRGSGPDAARFLAEG